MPYNNAFFPNGNPPDEKKREKNEPRKTRENMPGYPLTAHFQPS